MDTMVEKTFNKAIEYFKKGENKEAYKIFKFLGEKGDVDAQIRLGYMLFLGSDSIEKNIDQAIYWFKKADNGNSEAKRMLGFSYLEKGDTVTGITHLLSAANQKNLTAIVDLGDIYDFGKYGVQKDKNKALDYYTKGCKLMDYYGCRNLVSLLDELKINKYKYIKDHIGINRFIFIFIKNIFKHFSLFRNKGER